jgi:catechol 2,3-dioxygenase-like lactoylglutathione lyase family enzyme
MPTAATQTAIDSVVLEAADPAAARAFYDEAFGLGERLSVRPVDDGAQPSSGFRAFTLSLVVAQPANVDAYINAALAAGATAIKDPKKSLWGYGGVVRSPDGAIWKVATSSKKDSGPAVREAEDVVLLLGAADVKASKRFYTEHGLAVDKSFGSKYVQFEGAGGAVKLALYGRRALAKDAGVDPEGSGSHELVIVGNGGAAFTDPDGFAWR